MYSVSANPYASPADVEDSAVPSKTDWLISAVFTVVGCSLAALVSLGAAYRLAEVTRLDWPIELILRNSSQLLGIIAFAVAAWVLFCLMSSMATRIPAEHPTFSRGLVLLATVAMLARLVSEPSFEWAPTWSSFWLTAAAASAMCLLYRVQRVRVQG